MKTPIFETSPGALLALLQPQVGSPHAYVRADLYTFELPGGTVLRYAAGTRSFGFNSHVWDARKVGVDNARSGSRAQGRWKIGLDVDTWKVSFSPRRTDPLTGDEFPDKINNVPWVQAVHGGALDSTIVTVDRAYLPTWPAPQAAPLIPTGALNIFTGRVANVDVSAAGATVNIASMLDYLTITMPRNTFESGCPHTLFDAGCKLLASDFVVAGTVASGSTKMSITTAAGSPAGSGTYVLGRIVFTSGKNFGQSRMVMTWAAGTGVMGLRDPLPYVPVIGDTFLAYPGCDKTRTTCLKFANTANFGGQPYIPPPEDGI